ncbi:MAG: hypothetical protein Q9205_007534, partial [Flavoplaca limonia]
NALRCALENLPTGLDITYNEALQRIRDQKEEFVCLAENVLMWILFAVRPLEISELQHAIASISLDGQTDIGDEDLTDPETLLDVCGGIVVVDEESEVVRLVHYTTQQYFDRNPLHSIPVAQCRITKTCMTYLSLAHFNCGDLIDDHARRGLRSPYPFLCYAGLHWGKHARGVPEDDWRVQISELISNEYIRRMTFVLSDHFTPSIQDMCPLASLAYAAAFGLTSIINHLLDEGVDVNQTNDRGITALMSAAEAGYIDTVRVLLAAGADVNKPDVDGWTALMQAATKGHNEIVQTLLDNEANLEAATRGGITSLLWTARNGFVSTVRLLVDKGANMNAGPGLFQAAIKSRSSAMVELAASKIGEVGKADHMGNPLVDVINLGGISIASFELLIGKGADLTGAIDGKTPIHVAARCGNVEAVRSLFKHGVSPNIKDKDGNTPIHLAAFRGQHDVIEILVDHGADLTVQNNEGETALHIAAHKAVDPTTFESIMEHGADGSCKDRRGRTPLEIAAIPDNGKFVEQILERLAIPCPANLTRLHSATRLLNAVKKKDIVVINEKLKVPDIDVNLPDERGRTCLHFAASYGLKKIVESLLERGALVNARTYPNRTGYSRGITGKDSWTTPLHIAAGRGLPNTVGVLLKHGADLHATDDDGYKAFYIAAQEGHANVIKVLFEYGSEVSESPEGRGLALLTNVRRKNEIVVRLLLENGADAERDTDWGRKALGWTRDGGNHEIVELLEKHGFTTPEG